MSTQALKAAATGNQQVATRKNQTIAGLMSDPKIKAQMALALPKHMTADRLARIAATEVRKVPKLAQCDQTSFLGAIMQCAQLGLEPGSALGHAYLIPFDKNKKIDGQWVTVSTEVQFIIGYRGMIDLARRSGQIISISARTVYENDNFTYQFGLHEDLKHIPAIGSERGELTYVYAVAKLKDGGLQFEVMSKYEIDLIRAQSKASGSGPWVSHYEEMAKKTVIRRLFKYLPVSIEMTRAVIADESADAGINQNNASILTGEFDESDIIDVDQETGEVLNTPQVEDEKAEPPEKSEPAEKTPQGVDFKTLLNSIKTANDIDVLDADASLIDQVVGVSNREELSRAYKARRAELEGK